MTWENATATDTNRVRESAAPAAEKGWGDQVSRYGYDQLMRAVARVE